MKKLIIAILFVSTWGLSAQTAMYNPQSNMVEVYGDVSYTPKIKEYQATVILTLDNYYNDKEICTFEDLNNKFLKKTRSGRDR